jgi:hypothetical protein
MENGWIKLHRKFTEWGWYQKSEMVHLFLHLLLMANHKDNIWQGQRILKGQLVTGRLKIKEKTGLSEQTIRTCLNRLEETGEITVKSTNRNSIITLIKYSDYQKHNNIQPTTNQQLTTNKNVKKDKNINTHVFAKAKSARLLTNKKNMQTINIETGEYEKEESKTKRKDIIELAQLFDLMASKVSGKPIKTPRSYFIVLNAINKHKITTDGIKVIFRDWFEGNEKLENKVKLSFCLSANNINQWKVKN